MAGGGSLRAYRGISPFHLQHCGGWWAIEANVRARVGTEAAGYVKSRGLPFEESRRVAARQLGVRDYRPQPGNANLPTVGVPAKGEVSAGSHYLVQREGHVK